MSRAIILGVHAATARQGHVASGSAVVCDTQPTTKIVWDLDRTYSMAKKGAASTDKKATDKKAGGKNTAAAKNDDGADKKARSSILLSWAFAIEGMMEEGYTSS